MAYVGEPAPAAGIAGNHAFWSKVCNNLLKVMRACQVRRGIRFSQLWILLLAALTINRYAEG